LDIRKNFDVFATYLHYQYFMFCITYFANDPISYYGFCKRFHFKITNSVNSSTFYYTTQYLEDFYLIVFITNKIFNLRKRIPD